MYSENHSRRKMWTEEEDNLMRDAFELYGHNWIKVSNYLGSRSASQCSQRWKRIKKSENQVKKIYWTKSDERKLLKLVKEYGHNWLAIASIFGDRNSRQVREKYTNSLNPSLKNHPWRQEEDDTLFQLFLKHGCKWASFTKQLPNRSERMIKNRFYTKIRYSHLGLPNAYKEVNFQENPYVQIQEQRQRIIELQSDSQEQCNLDQEGVSQFFNQTDICYYSNICDIDF